MTINSALAAQHKVVQVECAQEEGGECLSDEEAGDTEAATDKDQENDPGAFQAVLTSTTKWPTFDFSLPAVSAPTLVMFGE